MGATALSIIESAAAGVGHVTVPSALRRQATYHRDKLLWYGVFVVWGRDALNVTRLLLGFRAVSGFVLLPRAPICNTVFG